MHLGSLQKGEKAIIKSLRTGCRPEIRQRLLDLGFVRGAEISIENISPLGDPVAYSIHDTLISLRKEDAMNVLIDLKK